MIFSLILTMSPLTYMSTYLEMGSESSLRVHRCRIGLLEKSVGGEVHVQCEEPAANLGDGRNLPDTLYPSASLYKGSYGFRLMAM